MSKEKSQTEVQEEPEKPTEKIKKEAKEVAEKLTEENKKEVSPKEEAIVDMIPSKILAFFSFLIILRDSIFHFTGFGGNPLNILWGIIGLVIAAALFISINVLEFPIVKIPFNPWLLLIYSGVLILINFFGLSNRLYHAAIILVLAAVLNFKDFKTGNNSKLVGGVGAVFAVFESVLLIMTGFPISVVEGIFGIILAIVLLILISGKIDIKIPYAWWTVLLIGFVFWAWIAPFTFYGGAIGGTLTLISFTLIVIGY